MKKKSWKKAQSEDGEFLWLMSLSDLMILLFIFFVVLYSFAFKKINQSDIVQALSALGNSKIKDPVDAIKENMANWVEKHKLEDAIAVVKKNGQVFVEVKDKVLFDSGRFELHNKGVSALSSLSNALEAIPEPFKLGIEGHTDDVPIHTKAISNNRDLSAKRAIAVYNAINFSETFRHRVVISAHGATQPLVKNRDENGNPIAENQSKNRRVTLRIF